MTVLSLSACSTKVPCNCAYSSSTRYIWSGTEVPPSIESYSNVNHLTSAAGVLRRSYLQSDEEYQSFKKKMKDFAYRMSEDFVNDNYQISNNFAFSPYSIELCLGLAIRCSNGNTRQEILSALGVDYETFNKYYPYFFSDSSFVNENKYDQKVTGMSIPSNSIWFDDGLVLKNDCLHDLMEDYYCDTWQVDFDQNNKWANEAINDFISKRTNDLLNPNLELSPSTLFVLMNTIYIRGIWNEFGDHLKFAPDTYKFKNSSGFLSNKSLLMGQYYDGRVLQTEDYSCFYTATYQSFNITFIKPNEGKSIKDVFTKEAIDYATGGNYIKKDSEKMERYHTSCYFPEFEAGAEHLDLKKPFVEKYNIESLFRLDCDFSSITDSPAYCEDFKQDAKLVVDKTGIEGAAVTYMVNPGAAGPDGYEDIYEQFILDKEFGFVVKSSDNIIFSGVVTNID